MAQQTTDIWAEWLLHRRHGGDTARMQEVLAHLYPVRDKVLSHVALGEGSVLLDVGCGDGLIAFGALEKSPSSNVIFSDISQELLDHAASVAQQMQVADRCTFLCASADDLFAVKNASVDAVTTRSVLIYIAAKKQAFREFYRVLKPGGQLSVFEPINRFGEPQPPHMFWGFDVTPVEEIAAKVKALYRRLQPLDTDPMMDFDERDLLEHAERAGFAAVHLELEVDVKPFSEVRNWNVTWESFLRSAGNPKIPTLEEAMAQALTADEVAQFTAYLRPLVETKSGTTRSAVAYLSARK
jgi:arsenite methyltransferase